MHFFNIIVPQLTDCKKEDKTIVYLATHADVKMPGAESETA
jgi:hypothetical protein